jgi:hypothetical protein
LANHLQGFQAEWGGYCSKNRELGSEGRIT